MGKLNLNNRRNKLKYFICRVRFYHLFYNLLFLNKIKILLFAKGRVVFLRSQNKQNFGSTTHTFCKAKCQQKVLFPLKKKKQQLIKSRIGYNLNFPFILNLYLLIITT